MKTIFRFSFLWYLLQASLPLSSQTKLTELNASELSGMQYVFGISSTEDNILLSFGKNEKRNFEYFSPNGTLLRNYQITALENREEGPYAPNGITNEGPLGYLENENSFLFFFPSIKKNKGIDIYSLGKNEQHESINYFEFPMKNARIVMAINQKKSISFVLLDKKKRGLNLLTFDFNGKSKLQPLNLSEPSIYKLFKNQDHNDFRIIDQSKSIFLNESTSKTQNIFPQGESEFLISFDPKGKRSEGEISVVALNTEQSTASVKHFFNTESHVPRQINSFIYGKHLFRLMNQSDMFIFDIIELASQRTVRSYRYMLTDENFDFAKSSVVESGGYTAFDLVQIPENIHGTKDILKNMDKGNIVLTVIPYEKDNGLMIKVASFYANTLTRANPTYSLSTSSMNSTSGAPSFFTNWTKTTIHNQYFPNTRFKSILKLDSFELLDKKLHNVDTEYTIDQFLQRNTEALRFITGFDYSTKKYALLLEDVKTKKLSIYTFPKLF